MSQTLIECEDEVVFERTDVSLSICLETLTEVERGSYARNAAIRIGQIAFVKDAP